MAPQDAGRRRGVLFGWLRAVRWQRLLEMEKLGDLLVKHFDGIAVYCDQPGRFGAVESLNTTIKAHPTGARPAGRDDAPAETEVGHRAADSISARCDEVPRSYLRVTFWCIQIDQDRKLQGRGDRVVPAGQDVMRPQAQGLQLFGRRAQAGGVLAAVQVGRDA